MKRGRRTRGRLQAYFRIQDVSLAGLTSSFLLPFWWQVGAVLSTTGLPILANVGTIGYTDQDVVVVRPPPRVNDSAACNPPP